MKKLIGFGFVVILVAGLAAFLVKKRHENAVSQLEEQNVPDTF